ncbi:MAG: terminase family protein [Vicinamibacterales bacterium]
MSGRRSKFYRGEASARAPKPGPVEFTFGYLHPDGGCPHTPPCSPPASRPFGGNAEGSRCQPQPKQSLAHASVADILFYGGAVGGGKSEYAIVEAITLCLIYPGSKVAIFRRTLVELEQELEGRIMLLAWADNKEFRGPNGKLFCKYNRSKHRFTFWNGSALYLCYCAKEADVYKYQSFQIIGLFIDESSHFTEFQVRYLITRVRSPRKGVPKIVRLTSNPGNVGHGWHKRWFIRPTPEELGNRPLPQPFEIWRPLPRADDPTPPERMLTRQFIPAWFHDNLALQDADPNYLSKVWALGGDKAKQLAEGDWDANDSMIVGAWWRERLRVTGAHPLLLAAGLGLDTVIPWHVIPDRTWRPPVGAKIYGSVDYGYGAPWSFHLHAALPGGHTRTFFEFYSPRVRDHEQAARIWTAVSREVCFAGTETPVLEGLEWVVYDPAMKGSRTEVGLAKSIIEVYQDETHQKVQFLQGAGGRSARMSRPNRWMDALSTAPDGFPWWSVTAACPDLIRTVPEVPWEEVDGAMGEVEDEDAENHAYEDVGRFFEARPHAPRQAPPDPFPDLDPISKAHAEHMAQRGKPTVGRISVAGFGGA